MYDGLIAVPKGSISDTDLELIKSHLTISNPEYEAKLKYSKWKPKESEKYLNFWYYNGSTYWFPRNILSALNIDYKSYISTSQEGHYADIQFLKKLRRWQARFVESATATWETDKIFEVPCGHGKTVLALYLAAKIQRKMLVLVTTNYLAKQWQERAKEFCGEDATILSSKIVLSKLPNISIITLDMFKSLDDSIIKLIQKEIGFVVMDEGHRAGAETYQPIIGEIGAKKRLCLTATFRRLDGKEQILKYHFGELFTMENQQPLAKVYPLMTNTTIDYLIPKDKLVDVDLFYDEIVSNRRFLLNKETPEFFNISIVDTWFKSKSSRDTAVESLKVNKKDAKTLAAAMDKVVFAHYDNYVATDARRVRLIKSVIHQCLKNGRTVLVLSKRKNLLYQLDRLFEGTKKALIISETNKMKPEEREFVQNEAKLILGINQLANEGLDVPRIDTVIFCHPITDTEQPIGRAGRVLPDKKQSLILYLRDNCWVYSNMFRKSINFIKINAELQADITYEELSDVLCQNN